VPITFWGWYGAQQRVVEALSSTAIWYSTGLPAVPLRWVLIRDPQEGFETQALLCTNLDADPERIISWFVMRWQMEATFQEARQRLGFETQRHWSDLAIQRTAPALLGLFSLVTLISPTSACPRTQALFDERPGTTRSRIRPSPMLWRWWAKNCGCTRLFASHRRRTRW
jgi:hypothetical protein